MLRSLTSQTHPRLRCFSRSNLTLESILGFSWHSLHWRVFCWTHRLYSRCPAAKSQAWSCPVRSVWFISNRKYAKRVRWERGLQKSRLHVWPCESNWFSKDPPTLFCHWSVFECSLLTRQSPSRRGSCTFSPDWSVSRPLPSGVIGW